MRIYILIFFLFIFYNLFGQDKYPNGFPLSYRYTTEDIAESQNWAVAEADNGVVYFGNNKGVVEFNGKEWNLILLSNNTISRSLFKSSSGRIYVGGNHTFGYLTKNALGSTIYVSLSDSVDSLYNYGDVWKITEYENSILFFNGAGIFKYYNGKLSFFKIEMYQPYIFFLNNNIYVVGVKGIFLFKNNKLKNIGYKYEASNLVEAVNISKNKVAGFFENSANIIKALNDSTLIFEKIESLDYKQIFDSKIFNSCISKNKQISLSTFNGVYVLDSTFKIIYHFDDSNILYNNNILNSKFDSYGNLWVCSNVYINYVKLSSNISVFGKNKNIDDSNIFITEFKNHLYLGSMSSLKRLNNKTGVFENIKNSDINNFGSYIYKENNDSILFLTTYDRLLMVKDDKVKEIARLNEILLDLVVIPNTKILYIGSLSGAIKVKLDNDYNVIGSERIKGVSSLSRRVVVDKKNNDIWHSTYFNGIYKIKYDSGKFLVQHFDTLNGLPTNNRNVVYYSKLLDRIIVKANDAIYTPYEKSGKMYFKVDTNLWGHIFDEKYEISTITEGENYMILDTKQGVFKVYFKNGKAVLDKNVFNEIPHSKSEGQHLVDTYGDIWFLGSRNVIKFSKKRKTYNYHQLKTLINFISVNTDSVLYNGGGIQTFGGNDFNIDYKNNSLTIKFSLPYYAGENKYKYKLEGYDKSWSNYSSYNKVTYTNLREGEYIFKVIGQSSDFKTGKVAIFKFRVLPPWYRTIWAYISAILIFVVFLIAVVRLFIFRQKKYSKKLERIVAQRTFELNEKNKTITDSINYAKQIQKAVMPDYSEVKKYFKDIFIFNKAKSVLSGDFYWFYQNDNYIYIALGDCTGHGVPGALMSMIGNTILNQIVSKNSNESILPSEILENLNTELIKILKSQDDSFADGMDISVVRISKKVNVVDIALANADVILIKSGSVVNIKSDIYSIGGFFAKPDDYQFTNYTYKYNDGDFICLFSDGYIDQFGGDNNQKYGIKRLEKLLKEIHYYSADKQKDLIVKEFEQWKNREQQIDDILVIGIKL